MCKCESDLAVAPEDKPRNLRQMGAGLLITGLLGCWWTSQGQSGHYMISAVLSLVGCVGLTKCRDVFGGKPGGIFDTLGSAAAVTTLACLVCGGLSLTCFYHPAGVVLFGGLALYYGLAAGYRERSGANESMGDCDADLAGARRSRGTRPLRDKQ